MDFINFDMLFDTQTGIVAFISYLWGNGAITRFIARLNQFLLLFSFIVTLYVYIVNNKRRSLKILGFSLAVFFILYIYSVHFLFEG